MKEPILLIEDDLDMQRLMVDFLDNYALEVSAFANPKEALMHLQNNPNAYKVIILDLMLPFMDGFDVCEKIREISKAHIIISSARGEMSDKILGYGVGADDYLAKPYEPRELVLKINSFLRRENKQTELVVGDFRINEDKMEIFLEDFALELTKIEFDILRLFLNHPQKVFSRETIFHAISKERYSTKDRTVDMHISNIRMKIADNSKTPHYIKSVWGVGYKFIG